MGEITSSKIPCVLLTAAASDHVPKSDSGSFGVCHQCSSKFSLGAEACFPVLMYLQCSLSPLNAIYKPLRNVLAVII